MSEKDYKDPEKLREKAESIDWGVKDAAKFFDCSMDTLCKWYQHYDIEWVDSQILNPWEYSISVYEDNNGYMKINHQPRIDGKRKTYGVSSHRLLAVAKYGFDEVCDKEVHHKNGGKLDNRFENIEIVNPSDHSAEHRPKYTHKELLILAKEASNTDEVLEKLEDIQ